jgi:hypothetical protein
LNQIHFVEGSSLADLHLFFSKCLSLELHHPFLEILLGKPKVNSSYFEAANSEGFKFWTCHTHLDAVEDAVLEVVTDSSVFIYLTFLDPLSCLKVEDVSLVPSLDHQDFAICDE